MTDHALCEAAIVSMHQKIKEEARQTHLERARTRDLLNELETRNEFGQTHQFSNLNQQVARHIEKLRRAFELRNGGLDYRTVDE